MTSTRRLLSLLLPLVVVLALVAELSVALVGSSHLRADDRREAAARAKARAVALAAQREQRAEQAYVASLLPIVYSVYDAVQPVQDVFDDFDHPGHDRELVRDDVIARTGVSLALTKARGRLVAVRPPTVYVNAQKSLVDELTELLKAGDALSAATKAKADSRGLVLAFGPALDQLTLGENGWRSALSAVFITHAPPVPSEDRSDAHGRKVTTRGSWVRDADRACLSFDDAAEKIFKTEPTSVDAIVKDLRAQQAPLMTMFITLQKLSNPNDGSPTPAAIHTLVVKQAVVLRHLAALASGFQHHDARAIDTAQHAIDALDPNSARLARAYRNYGARACADTFEVDEGQTSAGSGGGFST